MYPRARLSGVVVMYYLTDIPNGRSLVPTHPFRGGLLEEAPMRKFLIALSLVAASFVMTATAVGADTIGSCC